MVFFNLNYKKSNTFENRLKESTNIINKYPDRVPIIVEKFPNCKLPNIDKNKYLVPRDSTVFQLLNIIRKRIKINNTEALFLFINGKTLPISTQTIGLCYERHHDEDGFLYFIYSTENTFGK
jgi:GABA(A) receptor-associated protein